MKIKKTAGNFFAYGFLIIIMIFTLFPLIYTVASSFKTNMEIMTEPERIFPVAPTIENYKIIFSEPSFNLPLMFFNSTWYTLISVVISLIISSMAGYVFARGNFPLKKLIFGCFVSLMFIRTGGISIYATFEILRAIRLDRSLFSLVFLKVFGIPIVYIYLVRGYFDSIPRAIDESAKIDGCSFFGIYWRVLLPMIKPILATIAMLVFKGSWNDYIMPTIFTITNPKQQTLIVGLMQLQNTDGAATSWHLLLTGATITLLPVLSAYIAANKHFVKGLAAGAVKE